VPKRVFTFRAEEKDIFAFELKCKGLSKKPTKIMRQIMKEWLEFGGISVDKSQIKE